MRQSSSSLTRPVKVQQLGHAELLRVRLDARLVGAAPDQHAVDVVAAELVAQQLHRPDQVVHPVLLADLTEVDDQVAPALAPGRVRRVDGQALEVGAGAHHVDVGRRHPASLDRDPLVALVGGDHQVGGLERLALQVPQPGQGPPARGAELGLVHLGREVVVVEQEPLAEQLPEAAERPVGLRRVADVEDVEAAAGHGHPDRLHRRAHEAPEELDDEAERALSVHRQRVAVDVHVLEHLERAVEALGLRDR